MSDEQDPLLREAWGALNFILAFYEPGQTYLDTEAWKRAEAGGRAALRHLAERLGIQPHPLVTGNKQYATDDEGDERVRSTSNIVLMDGKPIATAADIRTAQALALAMTYIGLPRHQIPKSDHDKLTEFFT